MATTTSTSGSTFQFTGAISGLDTASIIQAMLAVEKAPLTAITNQRTALQARQTAYGQLQTLLQTLQTSSRALATGGSAGARAAGSSNTGVMTASASPGAMTGTYLVQVSHLATSTKATSTASIGTAITAGDLDTNLAGLALPGSVTAGDIGMVVDGTIVKATIGAPDSTTLRQATDAIAAAVQAQIRTAEGTPNATVTASIVNNRLQLSVTGAATSHVLSFGVGGDTSNASAILGLSGIQGASLSAATPVSGTSALGVVRAISSLDAAGLAGLTGTTTGALTINGATIAYNTSVDSLSSIVTRINSSPAGVVASLDRGNDRLILTAKSGGAAAISIADVSGTLGAALNLAPGTTAAQTFGTQAQVTIDGTSYTSNSNSVSTAIDGVRLTLLAQGSSSVTVTADATTTSNAVQAVVDAYNALADKLDTMTANASGGTKGPLATDSGVRDIAISFRSLITGQVSSSSLLRSLADVGVTTGKWGAVAASTKRLQFDATKLAAAIDANPSSVTDLLTGAMAPLVSGVDAWTKSGGQIDTVQQGITSALSELTKRETATNDRIAVRQQALEAKFAAMEATLAKLQTTSTALNNTIAQQNKNSG